MRITSTHVENTETKRYHICIFQDHLHTRGEYSFLEVTWLSLVGSPPHTWRILANSYVTAQRLGITSTHVENTPFEPLYHVFTRDHLHTRGEYKTVKKMSSLTVGSPPHTWRIPIDDSAVDVSDRITSTHVENTVTKSKYQVKTVDHLHTRGEYSLSGRLIGVVLGSPPHTWRILFGNSE